MDQQLEERLRVYEQENLASPDIVNFVRGMSDSSYLVG